jgi:hypothetical protein
MVYFKIEKEYTLMQFGMAKTWRVKLESRDRGKNVK